MIKIMDARILKIFNLNTDILEGLDRALIELRQQRIEQGLHTFAGVMPDIRCALDEIVENRDYFELVSVESITEMLSGINDAERSMDYVLVADLCELQLIKLLCNVQDLIMQKDDIPVYDEMNCEKYMHITAENFKKNGFNSDEIEKPFDAQTLMDEGYRIEFTTCGNMTVAVKKGESGIYMHSNTRVGAESYQTAYAWYEKDKKEYDIFGYGLGYHVASLAAICDEDVHIRVYEYDMNLIKLSYAFTKAEVIVDDPRIEVIPVSRDEFNEKLNALGEDACVHYPSLIRD